MASTTIDSKVVEMKFDNSKFEKGVKESLSTLDKLKLAMSNLKGNRLEIDTSSAKNNVGVLESSVNTITKQFSALEAVAVGALMKIGSQAVVAGEQLLKSLTTDQIEAGYNKYEQKTASVQTLVNSTGKSVEEINEYLSKLMWYSDETSYSFTDMTSALATMTSTGGDIDKLIPMIEGVANATAFAGKGAAEFSRVLQFGINQAYSLGYMQQQDWKTLEGATVNSKQLQEALIGAGEALGKIKKGEVTLESFRSSLKDKWLDTEVMERGFSAFSELTEAAYEAVKAGKYDTASEAIEDLAGDYSELASRAFQSAQEAKSFTEAIEATKDAVSSGWMSTFELIFGNYEQAKVLWTDLANRMWDAFAGGSEKRNEKLQNIMGNQWENITGYIEQCGISTERFESQLERTLTNAGYNIDTIKARWGSLSAFFEQTGTVSGPLIKQALLDIINGTGGATEATEKAVGSLQKYQEAINKVFKGEMGNGIERQKKLTEAEYDAVGVQKLINHLWEEGGKSFKRTTITAEDLAKVIGDLSDEEAELIGFTNEEKEALAELIAVGSETGQTIEDLIAMMGKPDGRTLLIDSFFNAWDALENIMGKVKEAFRNVFPETSVLTIYSVIEAINKASISFKAMTEDEEKMGKFVRTLEGVFSALAIIKDIVSFGLTLAWKIFIGVLNAFGYTAWDATAKIGDIIVSIKKWIDEQDIINKLVNKTVPILSEMINKIKKLTGDGNLFVAAFKKIKNILISVKEKFSDWLEGLKEAENIPKYILESLVDGFTSGMESIAQKLSEIGPEILESISKGLGLGKNRENPNSLYSKGSKAMEDFTEGFKIKIKPFLDSLKEFGEDVIDTIVHLPWGKISAMALGVFLAVFSTKLVNVVRNVLKILAPVYDILISVDGLVNQITKSMKKLTKALSFKIYTMVLLDVAVAIGIISGCFFLLSKIPKEDFKRTLISFGAIVVALGVLVGEICILSKKYMNEANEGMVKNLISINGIIKGLALVMLSMGVLALSMSGLDTAQLIALSVVTLGALFIIGKMIEGIMVNSKGLVGVKAPEALLSLSKVMSSIALLFVAIGIVANMVGKLNNEKGQFDQALAFFTAIGFFIVVVMSIAGIIQKNDALNSLNPLTGFMIGLSVSMVLMARAMKILENLKPEGWKRGIDLLVALGAFVIALVLFMSTQGPVLALTLGAFSLMMLSMGAAFLVVSVATRMMKDVDIDSFAFGLVIIGLVGQIMTKMQFVTIEGQKINKEFIITITALIASLTMLAIAVKLFGMMNEKELKKGLVSVGILGTLLTVFINTIRGFSGNIKDVSKTLLALAGAIDMLIMAVFLLGYMNEEAVAKGELAMAGIAGIIAIMLNMLRGMSMGDITSGVVSIAVLFSVITACIAGLTFLEQDDINRSLKSMAAIAGGLAVFLFILSRVFKNIDFKTLLVEIIGLVAIIASITAAIYILNKMKNPEGALNIALGMASIILALSLALFVISIYCKNLQFKTILASVITMGAILAEIGILLTSLGSTEKIISKEQMTGIAWILLSLAVVFAIVGVIGGILGTGSFGGMMAGATAFSAFLGELGLIVFGLLEIMGAVGSTKVMQNAMDILTIIATGIGSMVSGFQGAASDSLPEIGKKLGDFAKNAAPFFDYMKELNIDLFDVIDSLSDALKKISGGFFTEGLGEKPDDPIMWKNLNAKLNSLATCLKNFISAFSDIPEDQMSKLESATLASKHLSEFMKNVPKEGGLKGTILGNTVDLASLGEGLKQLGLCMSTASYYFAGVNAEAVDNAADAVGSIADMFDKLPKHDGILQFWIGDTYTLAEFGEDIKIFGENLKEFGKSVSGINHVKIAEAAVDAGKLTDILNSLPEKNDKFDTWFGGGTTTLEDFGKTLKTFAQGLVDFSTTCEGIKPDKMDIGVRAGQSIANIAATLTGTDVSKLSDGGTLGNLADDLQPFAEQLAYFSSTISTISPSILSSILPQIDAIIVAFAKCKEIDTNAVTDFRIALESFSQLDMAGVIKAFSKDGYETLKTSFLTIMDAFEEGITSRYEDISKAFDFLFTWMLNTYPERKQQFYDTGYDLADQVKRGFTFAKDILMDAFGRVVNDALEEIRKKYKDAKEAGRYLVIGLANGIQDPEATTFLKNAATKLGEETLKTIKDACKEESPSKATHEMGKFLDMGLANGITDYIPLVTKAAKSLGEESLNDFNNAMDGIYDVIDWDLNPVITPTLDLSYVKAGASKISSLFNNNKLGSLIEGQNGESAVNSGNTFQFTQNNYSPKPLSRMEIYRQTNNQINMLRSAIR